MKTSSIKNKGRQHQKYIADCFGEVFGVPSGRDTEIDWRGMGQSGVDIIFSPRIRKVFPVAIECKNTKTFSLPQFIRQAEANCKGDYKYWMLIHKIQGKPKQNIAFMLKTHMEQISELWVEGYVDWTDHTFRYTKFLHHTEKLKIEYPVLFKNKCYKEPLVMFRFEELLERNKSKFKLERW